MLALATAEGVLMTLGGRRYDWLGYLASLGSVIGRRTVHALVHALPVGTGISVLEFVWNHRLIDIPPHRPWAPVALILGEEICYYWFHRASHTIRWLWATHAVHHSPNDLNLAVAYQLGWTSELSGGLLFFLPLAWLGFRPRAVLATLALNLLYQFWLHSDWLPKLGPLEWLFNTPSHHRVHHACNPEYLGMRRLGANFGGMLIVFDRLFGTFVPQREDLACRYGLVKPLRSHNPLDLAFHEWIAMARDIGAASNWRERLLYLFGSPGWRPMARERVHA